MQHRKKPHAGNTIITAFIHLWERNGWQLFGAVPATVSCVVYALRTAGTSLVVDRVRLLTGIKWLSSFS